MYSAMAVACTNSIKEKGEEGNEFCRQGSRRGEVRKMKDTQLTMRVSVDKESLLGKIARIEKQAEELRFEAMCLRVAVSCSQSMEIDGEKPKRKPRAEMLGTGGSRTREEVRKVKNDDIYTLWFLIGMVLALLALAGIRALTG